MKLLENIHFSYNSGLDYDTPLFCGLSLDGAWGDIITIMGRSGCGKSTLLHLMNGILTPDNGTVHTQGKTVATVFQDNRLVAWKTIGDNIALGAKAYGRTVTDDDICDALTFVGLSPDLQHTYPKVLSGGMAKRVGTARALLCRPDILLIDESFNGLDVALKKDLMIRIASYIKTHQKMAICITHNSDEAVRISDIIYEMRGMPAAITPIHHIEIPYNNRSETMILKAQHHMQQNIKQQNAPPFMKYGFVCGCKHDHIDGFRQLMANSGWRVCYIADTAPFTYPEHRPDVVIVRNNHPQFEDIVRHYHTTITRILCISRPPAHMIEQFGFVKQDKTVISLKKWWGWDCLYDDLIAPIAAEPVQTVTIGHNWVMTVCAGSTDTGAGLCRAPDRGTEGGRTLPDAGALHRFTLRQLAERALSDDDLNRAVGISAINAHYNRHIQGDTRPESWGFRPLRECHGDKASVGFFPASLNILPDLKVIEREPKQGQYSAEQADTILPQMDFVIITAQTLMNGSLPRLLFLAQNADVMVLGPTLPMTDIWKTYGVRWVCATHVTDNTAMHSFISQGGQMLLLDHQAVKMSREF